MTYKESFIKALKKKYPSNEFEFRNNVLYVNDIRTDTILYTDTWDTEDSKPNEWDSYHVFQRVIFNIVVI